MQQPRSRLACLSRRICLRKECIISLCLLTHQSHSISTWQELHTHRGDTYILLLPIQRKSAIIRPIRTETQTSPHYWAVWFQVSTASQFRTFFIVLKLSGVDTLSEHRDDMPCFQLKEFGAESAEGDCFVEIRRVYALKIEKGRARGRITCQSL